MLGGHALMVAIFAFIALWLSGCGATGIKIKTLQKSWVTSQDCEYGAPCQNDMFYLFHNVETSDAVVIMPTQTKNLGHLFIVTEDGVTYQFNNGTDKTCCKDPDAQDVTSIVSSMYTVKTTDAPKECLDPGEGLSACWQAGLDASNSNHFTYDITREWHVPKSPLVNETWAEETLTVSLAFTSDGFLLTQQTSSVSNLSEIEWEWNGTQFRTDFDWHYVTNYSDVAEAVPADFKLETWWKSSCDDMCGATVKLGQLLRQRGIRPGIIAPTAGKILV